jgi:3-carboxy-cis,cis-muconate cycloisomerase
MGRQAAHDAVYAACRTAIESRRTLYDVLRDLPPVRDALPDEHLRALCDPANYLGSAGAMVDQVLASSPQPIT